MGAVALAVVTGSVVVGLGALDPPVATWWTLPGIAVLLVELFAARSDEFWSRLLHPLRVAAERVAIALRWPALAIVAFHLGVDDPSNSTLALATLLLAAGSLARRGAP